MYCSTCGAQIHPGRSDCVSCGAYLHPRPPVVFGAPAGAPATVGSAPLRALSSCHRCGYVGEGVSYFSKGTHLAGLLLLAFMSLPLFGAFAIVYYLGFHDHRMCPRCGKDWGKESLLDPHSARGAALSAEPWLAAPGGRLRQTFAMLMFVLAAVILTAGIATTTAPAVVVGAGVGTAGFLAYRSAREAREARRQAIIASLQLPVLQLASERDGRLTVTDVATTLGWPLPRAEKVLASLDDGVRVTSDVTDEGVILYRFLELAPGGTQRRLTT